MSNLSDNGVSRDHAPPAGSALETVTVPRKLVVGLLALLSKNVCNAGGYDKSMLRYGLVTAPEWHGKGQTLAFESRLGDYMRELFEAIGYTERVLPMNCRCNGGCEAVIAESGAELAAVQRSGGTPT